MKNKRGSALVVGAGISGMRSALDLAEEGYRVTLIDKAPGLGGTLRQLDYQFPTDHCGMCKMLPVVERDSASQYCLRKGFFHENIDIMAATELVGIEGEPGKFQVTLRHQPTMVDPERCIGCAACVTVCPVEVPDEFNAGLTTRKAVYLPVPHNVPNHYVVDPAACSRCGECERVCPTGAIDLQLEARKAFKVLVVDDELVVRDSIKEWLEDAGFQVEMAESGVEALEKLSQGGCSLLLLDVKMPGMDGVEVLKNAREMHPDLDVVMMTAYATVETAVEAMKVGAMDYLMKPFDPEALVALVVNRYRKLLRMGEQQFEVGAIILAAGFANFDPASAPDTYGYHTFENVVTSIEYERLMSGTGPHGGKLLRPEDSQRIRKIAWLQCVGSRNLHLNADYCSSVCCMFSIKEALLAKEKSDGQVDAAIFYMDMRTFGKDFQRYRERAERDYGVRFIRSRVHSVEAGEAGCLQLRYSDIEGRMHAEDFDLVVLATGQRPPAGSDELAELCGVERTPSGFFKTEPFSFSRTAKQGIFVSGSFGGLRDISESVIQAGSAAFAASTLLHAGGGSLSRVTDDEPAYRDVTRDPPKVAAALCSCAGDLARAADFKAIAQKLEGMGLEVFLTERMCTREGLDEACRVLRESRANRVLLGACMPYVYQRKLKDLGKSIGLHPFLIEVADIRTPAFPGRGEDRARVTREIASVLSMAASRLQGIDPLPPRSVPLSRRALVVGGGIAGMTAALGIAEHGYEVDLIERSEKLGGNLHRLYRTLDGWSPQQLLEQTAAAVNKHPHISVHLEARVVHSEGQVGRFVTTLEHAGGAGETIEHGVAILATGGSEAKPQEYGYGQCDAIVTQHELEDQLQRGQVAPGDLTSVVMIQCVGSREEPRNYCSRVCCAAALKNALYLKEHNPHVEVYILYRDMMAYGFLESYYTQARRAGVVFIQYQVAAKPRVETANGAVTVTALDPLLQREIALSPDLLVLSSGIVPSNGNDELAGIFGVTVNRDGFYQEAEYKWRPVEFLREGVFACGIGHSPRSITESMAMAEAASQRALSILSRERTMGGSITAQVRHSLCSLCQLCIEACPYGARRYDAEDEVIVIDELACQGCGACAAVCPNSASVLRGYRDQQLFSMLDAALEELF
ncbi:FAD-dependent oxidoreductase [Desulfoferrobacter suflitae]|uniref:FAD-dependent oxidoreductase n=1 Tax=Desulfoferrobacter suflitae TaxID=2865782 RepID=UPI0021645A09|nr:FAD-dependent oxidoreductase [Desulfoferrobacter suflitae]MCK8600294.1 FAD-dependent oxidoreductase [Desulfoferrobacter suflitae]